MSVEELKRLNQPNKATPPPMVLLSAADWNMLLNRLERLEASVAAQEALLRALSCQVGQLPTQAQLEALARDVAQMRAELQQAGKKRERHFSLPKPHLPYIPWSSLLLGLTALVLTGGVLWAVWFSWERLWSVVQALIP